MDEHTEHLKAAIDALDYQIKRLAVQANLYQKYKVASAERDFIRCERARKALAYLQQELAGGE